MHRYIEENHPVYNRPDAHPAQWAALWAAVDTQPDADTLRDMLTPEQTGAGPARRGRALPTHGWSARR